MTTNGENRTAASMPAEATGLRKKWLWILALGATQIIAGTLAVGLALNATFSALVILGAALLIASGAQIAAALLARDWDGFYLFLLLGIAYGVTGCLALQHPLNGARRLPLILAVLFVLIGLFRIVVALVDQLPFRSWLLFNGMVTVLLGVVIWRQSTEAASWMVGKLVGIELILNGATWSAMALGARHSLARLIDR
jgi:uncharacterized membrane protein HdeD (DUF308 family)